MVTTEEYEDDLSDALRYATFGSLWDNGTEKESFKIEGQDDPAVQGRMPRWARCDPMETVVAGYCFGCGNDKMKNENTGMYFCPVCSRE